MKILVLSDSHLSSLDFLDHENYDACIHCGDYGLQLDYLKQNQFIFVRGNCDMVGLKEQFISIKNKNIFVTHGDVEQVKKGFQLLEQKAIDYHADICLFGHTHLQICYMKNHILFLNPGSYPDCYAEILDDKVLLHSYRGIKQFDLKW